MIDYVIIYVWFNNELLPWSCSVAWLNMPMHAVLSTLLGVSGLVLYAVYHDCDPYLSGRIERRDQVGQWQWRHVSMTVMSSISVTS